VRKEAGVEGSEGRGQASVLPSPRLLWETVSQSELRVVSPEAVAPTGGKDPS